MSELVDGDIIMDMDVSEALLEEQEFSRQLNGMTLLQLVKRLKDEGLDSGGDKNMLIKRLVDKKMGRTKNLELEMALLTWSMLDMQDYLRTMEKPTWGSKKLMVERILTHIDIDDAVDVLKEYRAFTETAEKGLSENEGIVDSLSEEGEERKRKRDTEELDKATNDDNRGIEEEGGNVRVSQEVRQRFVPQRSRVSNNASVAEVTNVVHAAAASPNVMDVDKRNDTADEANWRVQRGSGDSDSVGTTSVSNVTRTRIGLMFTAPPSSEPDKQLAKIAQKWFQKMKESDNRFAILPWKAADASRSNIRLQKDIPNLMSKLRVYFSRVQAKSAGGKLFTDVYIQHSVPIADLRGDAEWFLEENGMGIYNKELQVESVERKGWLLYSTPAMDIKLLAATISDAIGVRVGLRWKYMNTATYEKLDNETKRKWMSLHLEVATEDSKKATRGLDKLYSRNSRIFPLGIRMRLVSEFRDVKGNVIMMGKHARLRLRQSKFLAMTVGHPADDIMQLDYIPTGQTSTLRSLIMSIQSSDAKTPGNLFHAVGKDWKGRFVINYLRVKENEASMIADGLIPYLQAHHGDVVLEFFDPEAVVMKEDWYWDADTKTIVNPLSKELDGLEAMDADLDFSGMVEEDKQMAVGGEAGVVLNTAAEMAAARLNMVVTGGEEDSVSTMGNPLSPDRLKQIRAAAMLPASAGISWGGGDSVQSSATMDTRMSTMEQTVATMVGEMEKKFDDRMDKFFHRMQLAKASEVVTQPPDGASVGEQDG